MSAASPALPIGARRVARPPAELGGLARIEGRRLIFHPVFLVGLALSLLYLRDSVRYHDLQVFLGQWAFLPLAGGTLIAANLAALRSRRDGTDELYGSLPHPRSSRIAGQLLGLAWTLPVSSAVMAAAYIASGAPYTPAIVELAQGPAMVVVSGTIGILLARMAPSSIVGALMIVAIYAAQSQTWESPGSWGAWLLPMRNDVAVGAGASIPCEPGAAVSGCGMVFVSVSGATWHLGYLVGVTLLAGVAALVRGRRPLAFAALAVMAALLAGATKLAAG